MKRMIAVLAVACLTPFVVDAADEPAAVIAKAIKAHGGNDVLEKMKAGMTKNKGKINLPGVGETDFTQESAYMLPDKFRENLEITVMGMKIPVVSKVDGDTIFVEANGMKIEPTEAMKKAMNDAKHMMAVSRMTQLLKDKKYELNTFGEEKVEGKPAIGIRVSAKGENDITLFFDKESSLLVKLSRRTVEGSTGTEIAEERIILAYEKNKDGIPMPKKVKVLHDGKTFTEVEVLEVNLYEKLDASEFRK